MIYLNKLLHFIGRKAAFFLLINIAFSIGLSFVELSISVFIQAFLVSLGFLNQKIEIFGMQVPSQKLNFVILFLIFIGFFRFIMQLVTQQSSIFANEVLNARLRCLCLYELFSKKLNHCNDISQINYKMTEIFPKASLFVNNCVQFLSLFFQALALIFIMFLTLWKESFVSLVGICLIAFIILYVGKKMRHISNQIPQEYSKLTYSIERVFKNIIFLNIMRIKNIEYKNVMENILNYEFKTLRINFLNYLVSTLAPFLGIILLVSVICLSYNYWQTSPVLLISFLYLLVRFIQNLSSASNVFGVLSIYWHQHKIGLEYFYQFSPEIKTNVFASVNELNFSGSNKPYQFSSHIFEQENILKENEYSNLSISLPEIEFREITFYYLKSEIKVLEEFSMNVLPGSQFGIIGASGAGKTTLLMLLFGLLTPNKGCVLIDSMTPDNYFNNPDNRVGYVGVEPFLIKGSLKENLLYGIKSEVQEKEIWDCLQAVQLYSFVKQVGLNYIIQEDQSGLSAGQKQRICLARAFLNKPTLLILDEATANLDEKTESEVALAVNSMKGKCTTIIVSHRKGIIKYVDNLLELKSQ